MARACERFDDKKLRFNRKIALFGLLACGPCQIVVSDGQIPTTDCFWMGIWGWLVRGDSKYLS